MNLPVKMLSALADETRLRMYLLLTKNELCVCELMMVMNMEQSRISHTLRVLKEAGLVESRREGKWIVYFENPEASRHGFLQSLKKDLQLHTDNTTRLNFCKTGKVRAAGLSKAGRKATAR
jgi:ArsR family transcriptional regulator